jgi:hypothetical protein
MDDTKSGNALYSHTAITIKFEEYVHLTESRKIPDRMVGHFNKSRN